MFAKLQDVLTKIIMLSIKYLNLKFLYLKLCIKDEFLDQRVNSIQLALNLICVLQIENM